MATETTLVRLDDLIDTTENKEVKLLAKIVKDYVKAEQKIDMGFQPNVDRKKD